MSSENAALVRAGFDPWDARTRHGADGLREAISGMCASRGQAERAAAA